MKQLAVVTLVIITVMNITAAYVIVNQPINEYNSYKVYSDAVDRCNKDFKDDGVYREI